MRMPRRPRRSGIKYIEDNNSRSISFSKRRDGLFRIAANLSILTGARIGIVVEAENGKMSSFGTPSLGPIMDSFLSGEDEVGGGAPPEGPDEQEKDKVAEMQNKILKLEENKAVQEQKAAESLARVKAIQERSRMGKLVYSNVNGLCADELYELLRGLARIRQEIGALLPNPPPPPPPLPRVEISGLRGPPPLRLSTTPPHSQEQQQQPPRRLPWVSSHSQPPSSLPVLRSSRTLPQSTRPQSPPVRPSSVQVVSRVLLRHTQVSQQRSSLMVQPQAPMNIMRLPNEAHHHRYNYQSRPGVAITGNNNPGHFSQTSLQSSLLLPPPLPALQIHSQRSAKVEVPFQALNLNPDVPSQNCANPHSFVLKNNGVVLHFFGGDIGGTGSTTPTTHPLTAGNQQPSPIPCGANGGHHAPTVGRHTNGETYEWLSKTLLESSTEGGSSSDDGGAEDSLGDVDWFGDDN